MLQESVLNTFFSNSSQPQTKHAGTAREDAELRGDSASILPKPGGCGPLCAGGGCIILTSFETREDFEAWYVLCLFKDDDDDGEPVMTSKEDAEMESALGVSRDGDDKLVISGARGST